MVSTTDFGEDPAMQGTENDDQDHRHKNGDEKADHDTVKQNADHNQDGKKNRKRDIAGHSG
jgi:hypothetical protein